MKIMILKRELSSNKCRLFYVIFQKLTCPFLTIEIVTLLYSIVNQQHSKFRIFKFSFTNRFKYSSEREQLVLASWSDVVKLLPEFMEKYPEIVTYKILVDDLYADFSYNITLALESKN